MIAQQFAASVLACLLAWTLFAGPLVAVKPDKLETPGTCADKNGGEDAASDEEKSARANGCDSAPDTKIGPAAGPERGQVLAGSEVTGTPLLGSARTPDEKKAALERKLDASLAEFDELLWFEKLKLENKQATADPASRWEGASAGGGGAGGGQSGGSLAGEMEAESPMEDGRQENNRQEGDGDPANGVEEGRGATAEAGTGAALPGDSQDEIGNRRIPLDIPDGSDDDLVARQLREAAMSEDDPALREKLWQEYRNYKGGGA